MNKRILSKIHFACAYYLRSVNLINKAILEQSIYQNTNEKQNLNFGSQVLYSMTVRHATNLENISFMEIKIFRQALEIKNTPLLILWHNFKQYELHVWTMAKNFLYLRTVLRENKTSVRTGQKKTAPDRSMNEVQRESIGTPPQYFCHEIVFLIVKDFQKHCCFRHLEATTGKAASHFQSKHWQSPLVRGLLPLHSSSIRHATARRSAFPRRTLA